MRYRLILLWVLLLCTCHATANPESSVSYIDDLPGFRKLDRVFLHFEDASGSIRIQNLLQNRDLYPFEEGSQDVLNRGYTDSAFWLVARLGTHPGDKPEKVLRYIELDYSLLDDIQFYIVHDGHIENQWFTGDSRPYSSRPIDHARFLFPLELNSGEQKDIYIRVKSTSSMRIPLAIWDPFSFYHAQRLHLLVDGLYFGILFLMFFYNLCLLVTVRDISYFYYIAYTFAITLFQLNMTGYGFEYLWNNLPAINDHLIPLSISLVAVFVLKFSQRILDLKNTMPGLYTFFDIVVLLAVLGIIASVLLPYQAVIKPIVLCAILITLVMLYAGIVQALKASYTARLFLMAWSSLLLGSLVLASASLGWLPANMLTVNAFMLGSAIEVTLLSITLAERLNQINREKTRIEKEAKWALERVNQSLQDNNRIKDEFLASISHELRTPMNGVLGCLQHINDEPISEKANMYLHHADRSARHMMLLVDSLLTYTELQSGKLVFENKPFQTRKLVADARDLFTDSSRKKGIVLNFFIEESTPEYIVSDFHRISQMLNNLLDNAVKFTLHGQVEVRIQGEQPPAPARDFQLLIQVTDTGIGIGPEKLTLIFERFQQADGAFNRGYGGLGIGLAVIKAMLDQLDGSIAVESREDKGSTFTIHIPCRTPASPSHALDAADAGTVAVPAGLRILVVEDNPVNQLVLKGLLKKQGYDVLTADNGAQAVDVASTSTLDAILMDCQMPVMDGFEATRRIRAMALPMADVPIIAVTANAMSQDRERCIQSGMNDYTSKPIDAVALNKKIIYWVNKGTRSQMAG